MSRWVVMCTYCEWIAFPDDMADGADKADAHAEVCDGPPAPDALEDVR